MAAGSEDEWSRAECEPVEESEVEEDDRDRLESEDVDEDT